MTRNRKIVVGLVGVAVVGWMGYANLGLKRTAGTTVNTEKIQMRDLEATVSASGKVQAKREVKVSNEASGKVLRLAVREGDMVTQGQVLVEIDPTQLQTTVEEREASLASAQSTLTQLNVQVDTAKVMKSQAEETLKRAEAQLKSGLISRETYEHSQNDVKNADANLKSAEQGVLTQLQRIKQEEANLSSARIDYTKVKVFSPISGIVTKRLIEEGEMARYSALSGGTDLLSIADMSGVQAEIEVDETDIPQITLGQPAKVTIDAIPDRSFPGKVTEVGNSPIQAAGATGKSTNFKVVVTLDGSVPSVRPGFTCTAVITTATRTKVMSVPIQAMTVRELIVDAKGNPIKPTPAPASSRAGGTPSVSPSPTPMGSGALKAGEMRKEIEGVFLVQNGRAVFTPVKVGIAGDKYFEVLSGLKEGDEIIIGPPTAARTLKEGDEVKTTPGTVTPTSSPTGR
jgi:HlyD family secretion protein